MTEDKAQYFFIRKFQVISKKQKNTSSKTWILRQFYVEYERNRLKDNIARAGKIALWVKTFAAQKDDLGLAQGTCMVDDETSWPPHTVIHMHAIIVCTHSHAHTQQINVKKFKH